MIKFLDIKHQYDELGDRLDAATKDVFCDGLYIGGDYLSEFEKKFAGYVGADHCVRAGNGLDALSLLLKAADLPVGSKVIIPNNTFIATALAVVNEGLQLVLSDVDKQTRNMSVETMERVWSDDIRAAIFVHLYGSPAGISDVRQFCEEKNVLLIEDCAQCHGAEIDGERVGTKGNCAWSFYPGKNLGAIGDGGAITSNDTELAAKVRALGNYGSFSKYEHSLLGVNSRLDPLQAAILTIKLSKLDEWNNRRRQIAKKYLAEIEHAEIILPRVFENCKNAWHLFVVEVDDRIGFQEFLKVEGIQTSVHYPSTILNQKCFADIAIIHDDLSRSQQMAGKIVSLPMGPHLSPEDSDRIIEMVNNWR